VTRDQDVGYQGGLTRPLTPREPTGRIIRADAGTRTPDPFITSEVLYQLSYVGVSRYFLDLSRPASSFWLRGAAKSWSIAAVKRNRRLPSSLTKR
jgi:hypothetical protein